MKRTSYQNGSVVRKPRKKGPDVWVYRYKDSEGIQKAEPIGSVQKYPTKADAMKRAAKKRDEINERINAITVAGLCDKYIKEAIPKHPKTADTYKGFIKRIKADWGKERVDLLAKDIMGVENWIDDLETLPTEDQIGSDKKPIKGRPSRPLSKKTKIHYKAFLHRLLEYAIKWDTSTCNATPLDLWR
jgi:hypothetical protein